MTVNKGAKQMTYHIVVRKQRAKRHSNGFSGPDAYVAIVGVPEGVTFDPITSQVRPMYLETLGCYVQHVGEFYSRNKGPRSAYARLVKEAEATVAFLQRPINPQCDGTHCTKTTGNVFDVTVANGNVATLCEDCRSFERAWNVLESAVN